MIGAIARKRPALVLVASLTLVVALAHLRILVGGTWFEQDHLPFTVPSRQLLVDALRDGRIPEWTDRVGIGARYAADPNNGALYPPAWLAALFPAPLGADLVLLAHLLLAGVGAGFLARRLGATDAGAFVAGAALVTSGAASSVMVNGIVTLTLAWTPWIAWAADRLAAAETGSARARAAGLVAVLGAAQILSGDPAGMLTSIWVALGIVLARASRRRVAVPALAAAYAGAMVLGAVAILPVLMVLPDSTRTHGVSFAQAISWSLHPLRLLELVWPGVLGSPAGPASLARILVDSSQGEVSKGPTWMISNHLGLVVLLFAGVAVARRLPGARGLAVVAAVLVLIALGAYTPFYAGYRALVLPERLIRYPERHLLGTVVIACALAGAGFSQAFSAAPSRRLVGAALGCGVALAGLVAVVAAARGPLTGWLAAQPAATMRSLDVAAGVDVATVGGAVAAVAMCLVAAGLALRSHPRLSRLALPLALAVIVTGGLRFQASLLQIVRRDNAFTRSSFLGPALAVAAAAPADALPPRLYSPPSMDGLVGLNAEAQVTVLRELGWMNLPTRFGLAAIPGYDPTVSGRLYDFWHSAGAADGRRVIDLLGVRFLVLPQGLDLGRDYRPRAPGPLGLALYEQGNPRPRAFVTTRARWYPDAAAVRRVLLAATDADPAAIHLVGNDTAASIGGAPSLVPCDVQSPRPEEVRLRCRSATGGHAVLLDAANAGWRATVDGAPSPIFVADDLFRAVPIAAGEHEIWFRYRTPGLRSGALISGLALALGIAALVVLRRRAR